MKASRSLLTMITAIFLVAAPTLARETGSMPQARLSKGLAANGPKASIMNINNITLWMDRDAFFPWTIGAQGTAGEYPKGTGGLIFAEGMLWGVKVDDGNLPRVRVNGSTYATGLKAGKVLYDVNGKVTGSEDFTTRHVWRVRSDYKTADLTGDAASFLVKAIAGVTDMDIADLFTQYDYDWNNWPVADGAPFDDVDGNGVYDPTVDIPGFPGATQTVWLVANDLPIIDGTDTSSVSETSYGSPPIGMELQLTFWAYDFSADHPLGNILFKEAKIIYTGLAGGSPTAKLDTVYFTQWSDPDLGDFGDDYVGVDTTLSFGYVYNGNATDAVFLGNFGLPVPAGGYDFLLGPIMNGDTLGMTVFNYFAAGSAVSDPDLAEYAGTLQWFNLMEGFLPRPEYPEQEPWKNTVTGEVTKFVLAGDPVTGQGDIDGVLLPPGDRRLTMTTGPFSMALGDTQVVVLALIGGLGQDNISSVTVAKFHDTFAQFAFDNDFELPGPPSAPAVTATALDGRIILNWGFNADAITATEETVELGFAFEGYNVYQLPSATATPSEGIKVATFDVVNLVQTIFDPGVDPTTGFIVDQPAQSGTNSGVQRFFSTETDKIRSRPISNGIPYYFGVTAYNYLADNAGSPFKTLESSPVVVTITPGVPAPGDAFSGNYGETIEVTHSAGTGFADITISVIDPAALVDASYTITFNGALPASSWNLLKGTTVLIDSSTDFTTGEDRKVVDGVTVKVVTGSPTTISNTTSSSAYLEIWGDYTLFGGANGLASTAGWANGTTAPTIISLDLEIRFTGVAPDNDSPVTSGGSWSTQYERGSFGEPDLSTYQRVSVWLPFEVWDVESDPPRQVNAAVVNRNADEATPYADPNGIGDPGTAGEEPRYRMSGRDYIVVVMTDYDGGAETSTVTVTDSIDISVDPPDTTKFYTSSPGYIDPGDPLATWLLFFLQGGASVWATGDVMSVEFTNPATGNSDEFTFSITAPTVGGEITSEDIDKINVFPNPYYGFHLLEQSREQKWVKFNHMPEKATIRIFNLGGTMVRVLEKNDPSQYLEWNLKNQAGFPVASGIYIAYIELPGIGNKILKLAIVQEEQILQRY